MSKPTIFATAPAVRSVVIDVYPVSGGGDVEWTHEVYPIVALEWTVEADGGRRCRPVFFVPYVHGCIVCAPDDLEDCPAAQSCAVACPWPESDDAARLAPYVEALTARAVGGAERKRATTKATTKATAPPTMKFLDQFLASRTGDAGGGPA